MEGRSLTDLAAEQLAAARKAAAVTGDGGIARHAGPRTATMDP